MADETAKIPLAGDVDFGAPQEQPRGVREIPGWLTGLVVLACLGGGAWFVWTTFLSAGPTERIVILDRGPDDGVRERGGRYDVRSGNAALTVTRAGDEVNLDFKFAKQEYLSAEQIDVLTKVWRLTKDPAMAAELKVTPPQMAQLQDNRARAKIELPDADRARLKDLFLAYDAEQDAKAKRSAETKLLKALDAVGMKLEAAAKASAVERTEQAKAVLTPEQMKRFDEIGKGAEPDAPAGDGKG